MNDGEPQQVSDEKVIIANRISDKVEDRTFRVNLTLKKFLSKKNKVYRLRVFGDGKVPIEKDGYEFKIDILIQNDFDNIF
jgi:ribosomal protein L28